eukprot:CAMPEP_0197436560 /NCGR_PEP_ID=MMETSP1175-20131217/3996_1 /TAXON_ID=1003142 /ORGANISM="Triceratium dubium, Strain CCMP147" /LENGTH=68 /DNA_ID=CAMNT_0042965875 /DNA_START=160 /DNA_END=363 /DNA_ORIENTATION=-
MHSAVVPRSKMEGTDRKKYIQSGVPTEDEEELEEEPDGLEGTASSAKPISMAPLLSEARTYVSPTSAS